jgi:hypothetical protein
MLTARVRLVCFTVVLFILSALPASASGVRILRLSLAQGDVQIDRNSGDGWEQAIVNMPVIAGARIYAAENSKAELEFEDGSSVRLVGPAQLSLIELSSTPDGSPVNAIQVDSGEVYVNARLRHHDDFRISAYSGESFAITKPSHLRFAVNEQTASLAITDGEAVAQNASSNSTIRSGETYNYILGQPASAARLEAVAPQPNDSWDKQRDSYNNQNAPAGVQYSATDDANAPGVADLGNYGNYSDVPGCGECWQPNDAAPDWDPFGYGAWSYYPGWGWTFVSGYPWGWTPFFYGNWFYAGGRGWWWHPGPIHGGLGWHPQPVLAGAPAHGFSAPHPPAGSAHRTVAVAGSHLLAGPIGVTHASAVANGFARGSGAHASATPRTGISQAGVTAVHQSPASLNPGNSGAISITGRKGSYTLSGPGTGRNGYELHRAPGSTPAPRSYAYTGAAPRVYNVPVAPIEHASSASSGSSAPHVSSGEGGSVHSSGGGGSFHGGGSGGGGSFHGGGSAGGGSHGGGGGGGGHR